MNKEELVLYLLTYFINESNKYKNINIPSDYKDKRILLRGLINMREPLNISKEILDKEDKLLQLELAEKNIIDISDLDTKEDKIILWQGDITCIKSDAIVNAANEYVLGCFVPNHNCIDNQIHTNAGIKMRLKCNEIMKGNKLNTSNVIITPGYNLPSKYVIHTVGPIVYGKLTNKEIKELEDTYINCLNKAREVGIKTIVFPCISTGVFKFPKDKASEIAVNIIKEYLNKYKDSFDKIVFNVFSDNDYKLYMSILKKE